MGTLLLPCEPLSELPLSSSIHIFKALHMAIAVLGPGNRAAGKQHSGLCHLLGSVFPDTLRYPLHLHQTWVIVSNLAW